MSSPKSSSGLFNSTGGGAPLGGVGSTGFTPSPQPLLVTTFVALCALILGYGLAFIPPSRILMRGSLVATSFAIILQLQLSNLRISSNAYANNHLTVHIWLTLLRSVDLLLLKKIHIIPTLNTSSALSFYRPNVSTNSRISRLWAAISLLLSARYIGTPWQISKIPHFSKSNLPYIPSRRAFLLRASVVFIITYLLCDSFNLLDRSEATSAAFPAEHEQLFSRLSEVTIKELIARNVATFWFAVVTVLFLTWVYNLFALVSVGSGLCPPAAWPPLFGSLSDAYTLRGFWGYVPFTSYSTSKNISWDKELVLMMKFSSYWHKLMRAVVESLASWISTSLLRLNKGTAISKYFRIFLAFLISGILHVTVDMEFGIPFLHSPAPRFFFMQALGIMFEEAVERAWRSYSPYSPFEIGLNGFERRRRWARWVGYGWVWAFFVWTVPSYSWEGLRIAGTRSDLAVPWSLVEWLGLKWSVSLDGM
ncbi:hypothetical protein BGZ57DRAFT_953307 [Hyaloscypha finlandica]|nr:hypothetical protein BGZ57DRAFT_953307 [Hyaloscypha finlandica]